MWKEKEQVSEKDVKDVKPYAELHKRLASEPNKAKEKPLEKSKVETDEEFDQLVQVRKGE